MVPRWSPPRGGFPLLIALHGRGEAHRGIQAGSWGWVRDYHLDRTFLRLRSGPLRQADLAGVGTRAYLAELNQRLDRHPFEGLVVACPFTPDIITSGNLEDALPFAQFIDKQLIPAVAHALPSLVNTSAVGIDGVSLGGRMALLAATSLPSRFRTVGMLQAAFRPQEIKRLAALLLKSWPPGHRPRHIRFLTSTGDPFRPAIKRLHELTGSIPHTWRIVPGPHDYAFNQGPGGYEMLLWHDRMLRVP